MEHFDHGYEFGEVVESLGMGGYILEYTLPT